MTKRQIQTIVKCLRTLGKKDSIPKNIYGLCRNIPDMVGLELEDLPNYFTIVAKWKHYSGRLSYPIPFGKSASESFWQSPRWSGTYGDLRREFARYLAYEYTKYLETK